MNFFCSARNGIRARQVWPLSCTIAFLIVHICSKKGLSHSNNMIIALLYVSKPSLLQTLLTDWFEEDSSSTENCIIVLWKQGGRNMWRGLTSDLKWRRRGWKDSSLSKSLFFWKYCGAKATPSPPPPGSTVRAGKYTTNVTFTCMLH